MILVPIRSAGEGPPQRVRSARNLASALARRASIFFDALARKLSCGALDARESPPRSADETADLRRRMVFALLDHDPREIDAEAAAEEEEYQQWLASSRG